MAQVVTNLTDRLVLVRLRSGATVHLGARESSPEIDDGDVLDNPRLAPLIDRAVVRVEATPAKKPGGRPGGRRKGAAAADDRDDPS